MRSALCRKDEDHADSGFRWEAYFCMLFGGNLTDSAAAFCSGVCISMCCISAVLIYRRSWEISEAGTGPFLLCDVSVSIGRHSIS